MVSGPEGGASGSAEIDPVSPAQGRAVLAYARTLLEPDVAEAAGEDALAAFRQAVVARTGDDGGAAAANESLLALTRLMTAVSVPDRSSPADRRQAVWASIGQTSHCTCRESAALLATRANGNIQPREGAALDEHLATCGDCRELSLRAADAEAAFRRELTPPKGSRGLGFPSVPRTVYGGLGVLIAVVVAGILLLSGGSGANSSKAALAPVPTQAATALKAAAAAPAATAATKPAVHPATKRKLKPRPKTAGHVATTPAITQTVTTPTPTIATTPAPTPPAAGTGSASETASTGSSHSSSDAQTGGAVSGATPASTAAVVSGSSSLPADSAPQQGIGSLTSTTP